MENIAFHRTTPENGARILKEGVVSFASRGLSLPIVEGKMGQGWDENRAALIEAGFKFRIIKESDSEGPMAWRDMYEAHMRAKSTFVRKGGVQLSWARDGVTVAIDLDKVEAKPMADEFGDQCWCDCPETHTDDDGEANWCSGRDGTDWQIVGDIPPQAVVGIVSDDWMRSRGFTIRQD